MASLNPLFSIYRQVAEPAYYHRAMRGRTLRATRAGAAALRCASPRRRMRMRDYPHQMSGGMRQRIVGAIALAGGPEADHRRRAHHQSRCDDPGAVPRPAEGPPAGDRGGDHLRHPQPRHRRAHVRPDGGDVRRQDRRARLGARPVQRRRSTPTPRRCSARSPKLGSKEPLYAIPGQPPNLARLPPGCAFHPRCPDAMPRCATKNRRRPASAPNWTARCWRAAAQPAKEAYDRASA